jgi:large subunit ribosomal protein L13
MSDKVKKTTTVKKEKKKTTKEAPKTMVHSMNDAFFLKNEARKPQWRVIDAKDQVLGRLATQIADILRGKDKAYFTPHTDSGDYVIVINAEKVVLTGDKWENKTYESYSGWIGGLKVLTANQVRAKHPDRIIELAVKRMLPKNTLSRYLMRKLRIFAGAEHPHIAQITTAMQMEAK